MRTTYPHPSTTLRTSIAFRPFGFSYEELPAFHAAYFMLAVIFAGIFNLGFFAVLIGLHLVLDFIKYRFYLRKKRANAAFTVFRESIADIALFFLALSSVVYLHSTLPIIAGLSGTKLTHVIVMRGLAVLLPKLTILHHTLRIVFNVPAYLHTPTERPRRFWSLAECVYASTLCLSLFFLAIAPGILGLSIAEFKEMLLEQLIPWNI
ncbi:hypothetical protein K8942_03395 [Candidatus Peribacteria bacterium]|nr:MAG: hypothetical protein K8942_03395 [Candidatus Peribacteria bacterium]